MIALLLTGCSTVTSGPTATPVTAIDQQEAQSIALTLASGSRPEVSGALATPTNVQATLMSLGDAQLKLHRQVNAIAGRKLESLAWLVTMEGLWANEAQAPGLTATQQPFHHLAVIVDADSGEEIESSLRP